MPKQNKASKEKALTTDQKVDVLNKHISAVHDVLGAVLQQHMANPVGHGSESPTAAGSAALPSRPKVIEIVCNALKVAQIMENAKEDTFLTDRFNQVDTEDAHMGKPHFRINLFIAILRHDPRLAGSWGIAPSELLSGVLTTPGEIADRIIGTA